MLMPRLRNARMGGAGLLLLLAACSESEAPDTLPRTGLAAGSCMTAPEAYLPRNDLSPGATSSGAIPLLRFVQMSDEHIMDEDGQAINGGSFLDPIHPAVDSAMRFQDEYTDEVMNRMIATINGCHADKPVELVVATGDNSDLGTVAEIRRFIDNLDGTFDRTSAFEKQCRAGLPAGTPEPLAQQACTRFAGRGVADTQTPDPDPDNLAFHPVATRMVLQLQDTERAVLSGRASDGSTDPTRQTANRAPGMPQELRCEAGSAGCANLRLDVPYYAAFGNHDGYIRGTLASEPGLQEISMPFGRHYMREQHEFIDEFFESGAVPGPVGHGFNFVETARFNDAEPRNDGYYAFNAGVNGKFRMIVMNTIIDGTDPRLPASLREAKNPFALADGTIDEEQFGWIKAELAQAKTNNQLVLAFSHHPDPTFAEFGTFADFLPTETDGFISAATLDAEFASYPNFVAWVAGHTHRHRIRAFKVVNGAGTSYRDSAGTEVLLTTPVACKAEGKCFGFWQIETASLIDFPQEARVLEFLDNGNGTGVIRSAVLQHDFERSKKLAEKDDLCSFYFTDPENIEQAISDADISTLCKQGGTRDGEPRDRNVELIFRMP